MTLIGPRLRADLRALAAVYARTSAQRRIEAARTPAGGWTRATLAEWGVPWPPPKGWKAKLIASGIEAGTDETAQPVRPEGREPGPKGDSQ